MADDDPVPPVEVPPKLKRASFMDDTCPKCGSVLSATGPNAMHVRWIEGEDKLEVRCGVCQYTQINEPADKVLADETSKFE